MSNETWSFWLSNLICIKCSSKLIVHNTKSYSKFPMVTEELSCLECNCTFPVVNGIPIIFNNSENIEAQLDIQKYQDYCSTAQNEFKKILNT